MIEKSQDEKSKVDASIKYQVVCDQTALVGVVKQKEKSTGELKVVEVEFGRSKDDKMQPHLYGGGYRGGRGGFRGKKCKGLRSNAIPQDMLLMSAAAMPSESNLALTNALNFKADFAQKRSKAAAAPMKEGMVRQRAAAAPRLGMARPETTTTMRRDAAVMQESSSVKSLSSLKMSAAPSNMLKKKSKAKPQMLAKTSL